MSRKRMRENDENNEEIEIEKKKRKYNESQYIEEKTVELCKSCGSERITRSVKKNGPNHGRSFQMCSNENCSNKDWVWLSDPVTLKVEDLMLHIDKQTNIILEAFKSIGTHIEELLSINSNEVCLKVESKLDDFLRKLKIKLIDL